MLTPFPIRRWLQQVQIAARNHPRRVAAVVVLGLGGFAATAFSIAPMAPDAAALPKRVVVEDLNVPGLSQQLDDLAQHPLQLYRHGITRPSDTADSLLRRLGVIDPLAAGFLRRDRDARRLADGQGNKMVQVRTDADGSLLELVARFPAVDTQRARTHFTRLTVRRGDTGFSAVLETAPLVPQTRLGSGTIRSSLWAATDEAQLPDAIASQLIEIFSADVDFHRELRRGDTFSVVFEALTADDQVITWNDATGRILAAEFVNHGRQWQAVWFKDVAKGKGAYFSPDGKSRQRSFLASPLTFSRVTSGFAQRFHPILQNWRAHKGVDYSAPTGTAVRTVADGVIEFAGRQNGYGKVVKVQHANGQSTLYAHLSRIDVNVGQRIEQGQLIGAVGATGAATGPHLHFEFLVYGEHQDPLTIARAGETMQLDKTTRVQFDIQARVAQLQLDAAESMLGGRSNAE
ncbi:MAG: M23 family metallopeptidase [Aquabacterium sp.]|nr:M23 family metallopeptidase [Aquabacterium sp.]